MSDPRVSKKNRIAAGLMVVLLVSVMLFSVLFISAEADHHCTGKNCPICACIVQCENTIHQISDGAVSHAAIVLPFIFILSLLNISASYFKQKTLISKKVRMDN